MTAIDTEVVRRLVTGHKNDGRAVYDPQAKAEVVRASMQPGVSVARMALQCGVNANLLRRWITQSTGVSMKASSRATVPAVAPGGGEAFIALQLAAPKAPGTTATIKVRLQARLPNGVEINFSDAGPGELLPVLELLGRLPCSDSTTR
jgi:transposase